MTAATTSGTAKVTLPADDQILIQREFNAPARLVWRALTEPELVERWWGAGHGEVRAEIDLRVGGRWRYVVTADGQEMGWHGEYRELEPGRRVVSTEVFEGFPDAQSVNTMTLTETDGRTLLETLVQHTSKEHRDGHLNAGMEAGMQQTFDALERLVVTLS